MSTIMWWYLISAIELVCIRNIFGLLFLSFFVKMPYEIVRKQLDCSELLNRFLLYKLILTFYFIYIFIYLQSTYSVHLFTTFFICKIHLST
jgi:Ulp1 family protease